MLTNVNLKSWPRWPFGIWKKKWITRRTTHATNKCSTKNGTRVLYSEKGTVYKIRITNVAYRKNGFKQLIVLHMFCF